MFDKLLAAAIVSASMGLNLNASTPNRAPTPVEKTLMNSTSYDIHFYHELSSLRFFRLGLALYLDLHLD